MICQDSHFLEVGDGNRLHVRRIRDQATSGPPALLVHGAVENGRIFYTDSGKGFAPFLASHGYDVFVLDLRGRGLSTPAVSRESTFGQTESIVEDIPAAARLIAKLRGPVPQLWGAHSWGGVLMLSTFARVEDLRELVCGFVFFGTKRSVRVWNRERLKNISLYWHTLAPVISRVKGYLPAKDLGFGADNESRRSHLHSMAWVRPGPWHDPHDGFDYGAALKTCRLPPALYLAGAADRSLGHPDDIRRLMAETHADNAELKLLSKETGFLHDYGHNDMLTHADAPRDHFSFIIDWVNGHCCTVW